MKKKNLLVTVLALMLVLANLLVSCSTSGGSETTDSSTTETGKPEVSGTETGAESGKPETDKTETGDSTTETPETETTEPAVVEYTVTFNTDGGSEIASVKVAENGLLERPADPTKDKHVLENWYTDSELTSVFDFANTKITKDITLYAKWTYVPQSFIVSFNTNGGSTIKSVAVKENETLTAPEAPTKAKHTFDGWFADKELKVAFDFATTKITADTTIYAKWTYVPTVNTVSYPTYNFLTVPAEGVQVTEGQAFELAVPTMKNEIDAQYNTFLGWYTEDGVQLTDAAGKSVAEWEDGTGDIMLVARFETSTEVLKFTKRLDGDTNTWEVSATDVIKNMTAVYVPASFEGQAVTKIGTLGHLEIVSYSPTFSYVDWDASYFTEKLEFLSIPDTVTYIDQFAFGYADASFMELKGGVINTFEVIPGMEGTEPFLTCEDGILFSEEGNTLFRYPIAREGVDGVYTVPDTVMKIGDYAFYDYSYASWKSVACGKLTKIVLPADITYIGKHAFAKRHLLETIEFTDSSDLDLVIDDYAFQNTPLKQFVIPGNKSFIPDNTVSIGNYAFSKEAGHDDFLQVKDLVLPQGLQIIGNNAFNYLEGMLESVFIPKTVTKIGSGAFGACHKLTTVTFEEGIQITEIAPETFTATGITSIVLPEGITTIGAEAFRKSQMTGEPIVSINIPSTVTSIDPTAFENVYMVNVTIDSQYALDNFQLLGVEARTEVVKVKSGLKTSEAFNAFVAGFTKTTENGYDVYTKPADPAGK